MQNKKTYKKPEIARVKMKPEDAVLTACKNSAPGPNRAEWCDRTGPKCNRMAIGS